MSSTSEFEMVLRLSMVTALGAALLLHCQQVMELDRPMMGRPCAKRSSASPLNGAFAAVEFNSGFERAKDAAGCFGWWDGNACTPRAGEDRP